MTDLFELASSSADSTGDAYLASLPLDARRRLGAVYTPPQIVEAMIAWAGRWGKPARIVDAGAGSGRYAVAAAKAFPSAEIIAVEIDPGAVSVLEANLARAGLRDRVKILCADYRSITLDKVSGRTLFIGNPPYVRHHQIEPQWKQWYSRTAAAYGLAASQLAGLHAHFFLKTRELAQPGDFGSFITSAEWLEVNYGGTVRKLLLDGLGCISLDLFAAEAMPFAGAMTTAVIACFEAGRDTDGVAMRVLLGEQRDLKVGSGGLVPVQTLARSARWTNVADEEPAAKNRGDLIPLGEIFRVKRGQVTGMNSVWVADEAADLPSRFLVPSVTDARELIEAGGALRDPHRLRRVIDLPVDLSDLASDERRRVDRFLAWARSRGAHETYIASHRAAWWSVGLYDPAPILVTYMGRRPPVFVRNVCAARHINIAHGLYARRRLSPRLLDRMIAWLNQNVRQAQGRTYAGSLTKFEPKEVERIEVPWCEIVAPA